jgi:hypothetical protein
MNYTPQNDRTCLPWHQQERIRRATAIVEDFADDILATQHDWQRPLALARKVKALGGDVLDYRDVIQRYAKLAKVNALDFWTAFVAMWPRVQFLDTGPEVINDIDRTAANDPVPLPADVPSHDPALQHVYSMCWHLAVRNWPNPFILSCRDVGRVLKCSHVTGKYMLDLLRESNLIVRVDDSFVFGKPKGQNRAQKHILHPRLTKGTDGSEGTQGPQGTEGCHRSGQDDLSPAGPIGFPLAEWD